MKWWHGVHDQWQNKKKFEDMEMEDKEQGHGIGWHEEYGKKNVTWVLEHGAWPNDPFCGHFLSWTLGDGPKTWKRLGIHKHGWLMALGHICC